MVATDKLFAGSIPEIYDRFLVPLIFEPYAADLAGRVAAPGAERRAGDGGGHRRRSRARLQLQLAGGDAHRRHRSQPADARPGRAGGSRPARVEWRQADALALPFADESFDVVACQFGVMFFPDKVQGYREARRVLRPGGRFLFNVWDRIAENEFADVVTAGAGRASSPAIRRASWRARRTAITMSSASGRTCKAAGFADVAIEAVDARSRAASARDVAVAYCQGTPLRNEIEARDASRLEEATGSGGGRGARFGRAPSTAASARGRQCSRIEGEFVAVWEQSFG